MAGGDDGFDEFAAAAWPRLRWSAYLLTGDHHLAEDLTQTALARTFAHWRRVRRQDALAYSRKVLVNLNIDRLRRRRMVEVGGDSAEHALDRVADREDANQAMSDRDHVVRLLAVLTDKRTARGGAAALLRPLRGRRGRRAGHRAGHGQEHAVARAREAPGVRRQPRGGGGLMNAHVDQGARGHSCTRGARGARPRHAGHDPAPAAAAGVRTAGADRGRHRRRRGGRRPDARAGPGRATSGRTTDDSVPVADPPPQELSPLAAARSGRDPGRGPGLRLAGGAAVARREERLLDGRRRPTRRSSATPVPLDAEELPGRHDVPRPCVAGLALRRHARLRAVAEGRERQLRRWAH